MPQRHDDYGTLPGLEPDIHFIYAKCFPNKTFFQKYFRYISFGVQFSECSYSPSIDMFDKRDAAACFAPARLLSYSLSFIPGVHIRTLDYYHMKMSRALRPSFASFILAFTSMQGEILRRSHRHARLTPDAHVTACLSRLYFFIAVMLYNEMISRPKCPACTLQCARKYIEFIERIIFHFSSGFAGRLDAAITHEWWVSLTLDWFDRISRASLMLFAGLNADGDISRYLPFCFIMTSDTGRIVVAHESFRVAQRLSFHYFLDIFSRQLYVRYFLHQPMEKLLSLYAANSMAAMNVGHTAQPLAIRLPRRDFYDSITYIGITRARFRLRLPFYEAISHISGFHFLMRAAVSSGISQLSQQCSSICLLYTSRLTHGPAAPCPPSRFSLVNMTHSFYFSARFHIALFHLLPDYALMKASDAATRAAILHALAFHRWK